MYVFSHFYSACDESADATIYSNSLHCAHAAEKPRRKPLTASTPFAPGAAPQQGQDADMPLMPDDDTRQFHAAIRAGRADYRLGDIFRRTVSGATQVYFCH